MTLQTYKPVFGKPPTVPDLDWMVAARSQVYLCSFPRVTFETSILAASISGSAKETGAQGKDHEEDALGCGACACQVVWDNTPSGSHC